MSPSDIEVIHVVYQIFWAISPGVNSDWQYGQVFIVSREKWLFDNFQVIGYQRTSVVAISKKEVDDNDLPLDCRRIEAVIFWVD